MEGGYRKRQVCAIFCCGDLLLDIISALLKEILFFQMPSSVTTFFLLLPCQTRSILCLLWLSYSLPPACSAIINSNQWREELSQLWLKGMTWILLSLWKPRFSEAHAESAAHCSVECSLPCQSFPTLTSWHSEKQLRFCAVWTWCCFGC